MAYNEESAQSIRQVLLEKGADFTEKKMFSGICFLVDDKMCCGTHIDKKTGGDMLLCRIGESVYEHALEQPGCIPMEFTGKPMKGFVFLTEEGIRSRQDLEKWIQLCLDFNPLAKKNKK